MDLAKQIKRLKMGISRVLVTQHPVKLLLGLALGAVVVTGAVSQFATNSADEVQSLTSAVPAAESATYSEVDPSARLSPKKSDGTVPFETVANYEQQRAADSIQDRLEMQRVLDKMRSPGGAKSSIYRTDISSPQDIEEFFGEDVVAILGYEVLIARLYQYAADRPLSSSEMERLDYEIDTLLLVATSES